jgi:predicted permease
MKFDWMDKLFVGLMLTSGIGGVARFRYSYSWIQDINVLPALVLITAVFIFVRNLDKDHANIYWNRMGIYYGLLLFMQFGFEFLREMIAGTSRFENYFHASTPAIFIFIIIVGFRYRKRNLSTIKPKLLDVHNEAQKDGN